MCDRIDLLKKIDELEKENVSLKKIVEKHFDNSLEFKNFNLHSDNTLMQLKKKELISYIHMLYHNWSACDERCVNIQKYAEKLSIPKPYTFEELKVSMPIYNKESNHDGLITNIRNNEFGKQIEYMWVDKSGYVIRELVKFNTSSFYPPSKANCGK